VDFLDRAQHAPSFFNDALADHRERIVKNLCAMGAALFAVFVVVHLVNGRVSLAGLNLTVSSLLLWTAWSLFRGKPPPLPLSLLGGFLVGMVSLSVLRQGLPGLLWAYPTMFICYFVLARRVAVLMSMALLLAVTACSLVALGPGTAMRVFVSLLVVQIMINTVLNVVGDLQQALVAQTITDPLTGAYNRRHMDTQLEERVACAGADGADALLVIDIDHFKRINDAHGHAVGDDVLRKVVAAVASRKRRSDLLFRLGGEEFVLLLPGATLAQAQQIAEDLRQRLAQAELLPGESVTVSIGVSALSKGQSADAWVQRADAALYKAKRGGRNRVVLAEAESPSV
jgi:diguanylate cyclase (GGDEF)-like protein